MSADPCPCCGHEPEDYGHAEMMAWFEEQARLGNTVKVALFTSGAPKAPATERQQNHKGSNDALPS